MTRIQPPLQTAIPSVDSLLRSPGAADMIAAHGRSAVTDALRAVLGELRADLTARGNAAALPDAAILARAAARLAAAARPSLAPVFNLTGTVLHTNLGRALLPQEAVEAMAEAATRPTNLEFDVVKGRRGDRDAHVEALICERTGAQAATVVNNNAAAVLLTLNSLANRREVPVSRGELIEIGGSFRIPDIMKRAGAKLVEVGTTNRTHLNDFAAALGERTALVMKVHTSNYVVKGFTAEVPEKELASLAHEHDLPFVVDLGSGTLADFGALGLPPEPTPADAIANGADLVTFSGDKLLGGPQAGLIVGRADLVKRIKRNPMKRALRLDKVTLAGLAAVLRLYRDPDRLTERLPTLRFLTRPTEEIDAFARALLPAVADAVAPAWTVEAIDCASEIGSGALPTRSLPSRALRIYAADRHGARKRTRGRELERLAAAFRALPIPVIGRIHDDGLELDLRCLDDEDAFIRQLPGLALGDSGERQ